MRPPATAGSPAAPLGTPAVAASGVGEGARQKEDSSSRTGGGTGDAVSTEDGKGVKRRREVVDLVAEAEAGAEAGADGEGGCAGGEGTGALLEEAAGVRGAAEEVDGGGGGGGVDDVEMDVRAVKGAAGGVEASVAAAGGGGGGGEERPAKRIRGGECAGLSVMRGVPRHLRYNRIWCGDPGLSLLA